MLKNLQQKTAWLFLLLFLPLWAGIVLLVMCNNHIAVTVTAVVICAMLAFLGPRLGQLPGLEGRRSAGWYWPVFICLAAVFFVLCAAFGLAGRCALPSDTDIVYDAVADLLRDGRVDEVNPELQLYYPGIGLETNADYFARCYNNIALLLLLAGVYRLAGEAYTAGSVEGQTPALLFTALCVLVTVLLVCRIVRQLTGRRSAALLALLLCMAFQPFYYSTVNFYTDSIVLPFAMGAVACVVQARCTGRDRWYAFAGAVLGIAVLVKITAAILAVAFGICILLFAPSWRSALRRLVLLCAPLAAVMVGFDVLVQSSGWFDFSRKEELSMPMQLWLCFGAKGVGYQYDEALLAATTPPDQRSAVLWQRLAQIYGSYTPGQLLQLQLDKLVATWGDGRFEADTYAAWPHWVNWSVHFTQPAEPVYIVLYWFGQAYVLALYMGLGLAVLRALRSRQLCAGTLAAALCVFGTVLYLLLFETAARRALLALPLVIAVAACLFTEPRQTKAASLSEKDGTAQP